MKNAYRLRLATLLAAALLALGSCSDSYGVFSNIQKETKQTGTDYFKKNSITGFYKLGSNYYASAAKLYTRAVGDTAKSWSVALINGTTSYQLKAAAQGGGYLYVSILDSASANKLYSFDGTTWTPLDLSSVTGADWWIDGLFFAGGDIFAQVHANVANDSDNTTDDTYSLYFGAAGSSTLAGVSGLQGLDYHQPFIGVVSDGSSYWYATRGSQLTTTAGAVYTGAPTGTPTALAGTNSPAAASGNSAVITSIGYDTYNSVLYVGSYTGYVFRYAASAWSNAKVDSYGAPVSALGFVSASKMLVGMGYDDSTTSYGGYYEGSWGSFATGKQDNTAYVTCSESVYSTTVSAKAVNAFYWDSATTTLFICLFPGTASSTYYGLYDSVLSGSAWTPGWVAE